MSGFLFEQIIFGPIRSRRLGVSLGVNLLPLNAKICSFNCLYCECGLTTEDDKNHNRFPKREEVKSELEEKLIQFNKRNAYIDNITFAGNGEPTLNPDFSDIIDDTIELRNRYMPDCKISVLCNSSMTGEEKVFKALLKVDKNILKLDAGREETFRIINNPRTSITLQEIVENLKNFRGKLIIQSLFVKGNYNGEYFDNTTEDELNAWLKHIKAIKPEAVMIYSIARETPVESVEKISPEKLFEIAQKVEAIGVETEVY